MTWLFIYNLVFFPFKFILFLLIPLSKKIEILFTLRRGLKKNSQNIQKKAEGRPLWVLHGASVGELYQVSSIIPHILNSLSKKSFKDKSPFFILTYFSPSATGAKASIKNFINRDIDLIPLPWDDYFSVRDWVKALNPRVFVAASYDLWPNLIWSLNRNKTSCFLISALLSPGSGRFRGILSPLHKTVYNMLKSLDTTDPDTTLRYKKYLSFKVPIYTSGDTRCDFIAKKIFENKRQGKNRKIIGKIKGKPLNSKKKTLIFLAASVYKKCDIIILPEIENLLSIHSNLKIIYVPHHTDETRISEITECMSSLGLKFTRLNDLLNAPTKDNISYPIILIDTIGLLIDLYSIADFAFIGGSFHRKIHNTFEPACFGLPLSFGPLYTNAPEAIQFADAGGAQVVRNGMDFSKWLTSMLNDSKVRKRMGSINKSIFNNNLGSSLRASERILSALEENGSFTAKYR